MALNTSKEYSDTSIVNNEGSKGLRERPATLLGSSDERGCTHAIFEIIANSLDEYRQGYGENIIIKVDKDNSVTIIDEGRGVPMGWNSKAGKFNWELVFCTLYASGKGKGGGYSSSEGLNGIGCTAAQYTSDYMEVRVNRVNDAGKLIHYEMNFKDGEPVGKCSETDITGTDAKTGTSIKFRPSYSVFTKTDISKSTYDERLRKKAMVVPGVRILFTYKDSKEIEYYYKNGMTEFIENNSADRINKKVISLEKTQLCNDAILSGRPYNADDNYTGESRLAIAFVPENGKIEVFHNGAILSSGGGTQDIIIDTCIKYFTDAGRRSGKLGPAESLNASDIDGMIMACGETRCPGEKSAFEHQTKAAIENPSLIQLVGDNVKEGLNRFELTSKREFDKVFNELLINKNARDKAKSIKKSQIKKMTQDIHKIGNEPEKLLPAKSKNAAECELLIIEGDSAKGAVSSARDGRYQAVFPLRGKIPNCNKKSMESLVNSSIITDLVAILGCGTELSDRDRHGYAEMPPFNISKLNYDRIILTTDADVDGGHITCLLLMFFRRFFPTLIKTGHIYVAVSPLFFVTVDGKKDVKYYGYNDEDRDSIIKGLLADGVARSKIHVQRSKGLGENSEDDMYNTVLNPKTRRLIQVQFPEDTTELNLLCEQLLGNDLDSRREIVKEYFNSVDALDE